MRPRAGETRYDILVVGARCSGASLAIHLARAGARVAMIDKDRLPSDHIVSTHGINPAGVSVLDEIGVGNAMRQVTPPCRHIRLNTEGVPLDLTTPDDAAWYCPRRGRFDALLQDAARDAGAELYDRTRIVSLVHGDGRVVGARVSHEGRERTIAAGLVIGADGRHSTVAKLVGADEYLGYDGPRIAYWSYWPAPRDWGSNAVDMYFSHINDRPTVVFTTDHGNLLCGAWPLRGAIDSWRADPARALEGALLADPLTATIVGGAQPLESVRGTVSERFFFRRATGPGWALVGDAGHHKEFMLGDGMTESLLQARGLALEILAGSDTALVRWWRARDVDALPAYLLGKLSASRPRPPELQRVLANHMQHDPALKVRLVAFLKERRLQTGVMPLPRFAWWTLRAVLTGKLRVIPEMFEGLGAIAAALPEMRRRRKLLAEAERASQPLPPSRQAHRLATRPSG